MIDNQSEVDFNDFQEDIDPQEDEENAPENSDSHRYREENQALHETMSNNIPLQRIVVSVKHQKRRSSKVLKQGWMIHYTERDSTVSFDAFCSWERLFAKTIIPGDIITQGVSWLNHYKGIPMI